MGSGFYVQFQRSQSFVIKNLRELQHITTYRDKSLLGTLNCNRRDWTWQEVLAYVKSSRVRGLARPGRDGRADQPTVGSSANPDLGPAV